MTRAKLEKRIDDLARKYSESLAAEIKAAIDDLNLNLGKLRRGKPMTRRYLCRVCFATYAMPELRQKCTVF